MDPLSSTTGAQSTTPAPYAVPEVLHAATQPATLLPPVEAPAVPYFDIQHPPMVPAQSEQTQSGGVELTNEVTQPVPEDLDITVPELPTETPLAHEAPHLAVPGEAVNAPIAQLPPELPHLNSPGVQSHERESPLAVEHIDTSSTPEVTVIHSVDPEGKSLDTQAEVLAEITVPDVQVPVSVPAVFESEAETVEKIIPVLTTSAIENEKNESRLFVQSEMYLGSGQEK